MATIDISIFTLQRLFALSKNKCAFPDCKQRLVGGDTPPPSLLYIQTGDQCHYDNLGGSENLILLCDRHHRVVTDNRDDPRFAPLELLRVKAQHELTAGDVFLVPEELALTMVSQRDRSSTGTNRGTVSTEMTLFTTRFHPDDRNGDLPGPALLTPPDSFVGIIKNLSSFAFPTINHASGVRREVMRRSTFENLTAHGASLTNLSTDLLAHLGQTEKDWMIERDFKGREVQVQNLSSYELAESGSKPRPHIVFGEIELV